MSLSPIYVTLNLLLLLTFYVVGKEVSKHRGYWKYAFWCVLGFTFVQGFRYMRGHDYGEYSWQFQYHNITTNPMFVHINEFLSIVGFNRYSCFVFYSFVFVVGGLYFLKQYREYGKYLFPFFLLGFMVVEEYMIRQAFSYSFFFCYLAHLFKLDFFNLKTLFSRKKDIVLCAIFLAASLSIHTANVLNFVVITALYVFVRFPVHYKFAIPCYVLCVYVFPKVFDFQILNPVLDFMASNNERASVYVANSSKWFGADAMEDRYTRNAIVQLIEVVGTSSLLYLGYVVIKEKFVNNQSIKTLFNTFILGVSMMSLFRNLELLNRVGQLLYAYWFVVLGVVLYHKSCIQGRMRKVIYLGLIWFLYDYLKYLFFRGDMTKFIWDAPSYVSFFGG